MFVQRHDSREQLDFVAEFGEDQGAGLESGVHENALAEGQSEWHRLRRIKPHGKIGEGRRLSRKSDDDIGKIEPRFVDDERGDAGPIGEGHLPGAVARPAMLDGVVENHVNDERDDEGQNEMLERS